MTPEQSYSEIQNQIYAYRIKNIIHELDRLVVSHRRLNDSQLPPTLASNSFRTNMVDLNPAIQSDRSNQLLPDTSGLPLTFQAQDGAPTMLRAAVQMHWDSRQIEKNDTRSKHNEVVWGFRGNISTDNQSRVQLPEEHRVGDWWMKQSWHTQALCADIPDTLGKSLYQQ
ncbi:unnamed protein product, partial [Candidula unifasciata]